MIQFNLLKDKDLDASVNDLKERIKSAKGKKLKQLKELLEIRIQENKSFADKIMDWANSSIGKLASTQLKREGLEPIRLPSGMVIWEVDIVDLLLTARKIIDIAHKKGFKKYL